MAGWSDIFRAFHDREIPVFLPGMHRGICKRPYVVVEFFGTIPDVGKATAKESYGLTVYVPVDQTSRMTELIGQIQQAMQSLNSSFCASGKVSELTLDETFRSAKATVYYDRMRKLA